MQNKSLNGREKTIGNKYFLFKIKELNFLN